MTSRSRSLGTIALVMTAALWGSNHVVARAARETVPLPALVFWRWALAALALTVIALPALRLAWPDIRPRLAELALGGAVGVGLFSYFLLGGAYQSLAIEVSFINATTPIWVLLIGLLTGRRKEDAVTPAMIAGLALAFAGTLLIISKGRVEVITGLHLICMVLDPGARLDARRRAIAADGGHGMVGRAARHAAGLSRLDPVWRPVARLA
jgi:drug/metabolite transporter (DMT)-like permease